MGTSFNERFDQHGAWRREFALRLKLLAGWMKEHDLLDAALQERLWRLESQVRVDKLMLAFVGEFSRGKSELINAIFFAAYGQRIMPASAGRTTMCPTELGFDAAVAPCLRLLPIETRLQPQALMEWRMAPEEWTHIDLDVKDPKQLSQALAQVAEVRLVSPDDAKALGFWPEATPRNRAMANAQGLVAIPRWRHALINMAHPLLRQGLVILDTPGLNAVGAEPELTASLIPQAHAVLFMLGADTGVTQSDLAIWREHLTPEPDAPGTRLVVLNKIDTLWDALSTPAQMQAQIERQRVATAEILGISPQQVIAVSAQKGLVAKVTSDPDLLAQSGLPALEDALGQCIVGRRQQLLGAAVSARIAELRLEAGRLITIRRRDLTEQRIELQGLRGKNSGLIKTMRARIVQEQAEFEQAGATIHAVRSVHLKLLGDVFTLLGPVVLKQEMMQLTRVLQQKGLKLGLKRAYGDTFERLRDSLHQVQAVCAEIQRMLQASFEQLNAEYGFALQAPHAPLMDGFLHDLVRVERSHLQYLGLGNTFRLAQPAFAERLVRALSTRLRTLHEAVLADMALWNKATAAQLDAQLRERHRNFGRRLDAIDRIQQAANGLDLRIAEIQAQESALHQLDVKLLALTDYLLNASSLVRPVSAQAAQQN